jgi:uncharacterized membrane protein
VSAPFTFVLLPEFARILGVWKLLGVVAVLVLDFPRLKEWAYAGMFFTVTGAAVSHLAVHDSAVMLIAPLGFAVLVIVSWSLCTSSRSKVITSSSPPTRTRTIAYWIVTSILAAECFVGGVMGALRMPPFNGIMDRLGYPPYFMTILGVSYLLAGIAILLPRFPKQKNGPTP